MKKSQLLTLLLLTIQFGFMAIAHAHDEKNTVTIHLTKREGLLYHTSDARFKFFTKQDLFLVNDDEMVDGVLMIEPKLASRISVSLEIFKKTEGALGADDRLGILTLEGAGPFEGTNPLAGFKIYGVILRKHLFDNSELRMWDEGEGEDKGKGYVLHFHKPKNGEQGGTGQPATRSQSKSEGSDKLQPEAEGRSR
jgi:hypothetical protein